MNKKIVSASAVSLATFFVGQVLRFVGNVVLAKLLLPSAFGVVAIVNLLILALTLLSDVGMRQIIIQRQGEVTPEFANTVWTMQILRGLGICLLAIASAVVLRSLQVYGVVDPHTAYADPLLPFLLSGAALAAVFQGLESSKTLTERRALSLGKVSAIQLLAQILAMASMISIAYAFATPWALVVGGVVAAFVQFVLSHLWLPGERNRWTLNRAIAVEVLTRGRWIFLSSIVTFLGGNSDTLILGGLVNPESLGNYVIAFQLVNVLQVLGSTLSGNIVFPALSALNRENPAGLKKGYTKMQFFSDALLVTAAGVFFTSGEAIVNLLFNTRYAMAGEILSCLAIGVVGSRCYVIEQIMNADGNFRLTTIIAILRLLFLIAATYVGFYANGLVGAAVAVGLSAFGIWPIALWYRTRKIGFSWQTEVAAIVFVGVGSGLGILLARVIHFFKS
ncbi:MAG: oligosaccharide flippase family protein [Rhizobacter sp.]|nr:oligosaccharide flippase family protein [Rhizobacter sp.]